MIKRGDKTAQFYLIAAMILIVIIIGIVNITNYFNRGSDVNLDGLVEEIKIESAKVLDFGVAQGYNDDEMNALLSDFTQNYTEQEKNTNFYFIFGDKDKITFTGYQVFERVVSINFGSLAEETINGEFEYTYDPAEEQDSVVVTIEDVPHEFVLTEGENFYFVISKEVEGEKYVVEG